MKRKIVMATDFSSPNQKALDFLMENHDDSDHIVFLHVISNDGFSYPTGIESEVDSDMAKRAAQLKSIAEKFTCKTEIKVMQGNITNTISSYAKKSVADFLVIGHHRFSFFDRLLNRDIRKELLNNPPCPILCC